MSTEFKWTDELIQEYAEFYRFSSSRITLEQFKASKQPKPEWEITALKGYGEVYPLMAEGSGQYHTESHTVSLVWALANDFAIYSVKRLSDGTLWSINDKFSANAGCDLTIKSFEVDGCGMKIWSVEYGYWPLNSINKIPILTTIDGVKIFDGYHYYFICSDWSIRYTGDNYSWIGGNLKAFSTKEKAEAFRIMNQPLFSISDIHDEYKLSLTSIERWIQKAKDKINPTT